MDFSNVKQMFIEVGGVQKEVSQLQDSHGNVIWKKEEEHVLPSEYQRVEYIESTGTQYIDTDHLPTSSTRMVIDCAITPASFGDWAEHGTSGSDTFAMGAHNDLIYYGLDSQDISTGVTHTSGRRYVYDLNNYNTTYQVYDTVSRQFVVDIQISSYTASATHTIYVFRYNGGSSQFCPSKVYSCQIYESGTLVMDMVPCYRKSDDEPGLYDLIGGEFYVNQGSGDFIVGQLIIPITQSISTILINPASVTIGSISESVSAVTNSNNANKAVSDTISDITLTMPTITITQISESVGTDFNV